MSPSFTLCISVRGVEDSLVLTLANFSWGCFVRMTLVYPTSYLLHSNFPNSRKRKHTKLMYYGSEIHKNGRDPLTCRDRTPDVYSRSVHECMSVFFSLVALVNNGLAMDRSHFRESYPTTCPKPKHWFRPGSAPAFLPPPPRVSVWALCEVLFYKGILKWNNSPRKILKLKLCTSSRRQLDCSSGKFFI
jgi:hypothetical protein